MHIEVEFKLRSKVLKLSKLPRNNAKSSKTFKTLSLTRVKEFLVRLSHDCLSMSQSPSWQRSKLSDGRNIHPVDLSKQAIPNAKSNATSKTLSHRVMKTSVNHFIHTLQFKMFWGSHVVRVLLWYTQKAKQLRTNHTTPDEMSGVRWVVGDRWCTRGCEMIGVRWEVWVISARWYRRTVLRMQCP